MFAPVGRQGFDDVQFPYLVYSESWKMTRLLQAKDALDSADVVCEVNVLAYMHDLGNKVLSDHWELGT